MAEVLQEGDTAGQGHQYVGLASGLIKKRISNHYQSFEKPEKKKQSKLSEFVWDLKASGKENFHIHWTVIAKEGLYNKRTRKCQLFLREKVEILKLIRSNPRKAINKRKEVFRRCLHRNKHFLGYLLNGKSINHGNPEDHNFFPDKS